MSTYISWDCCTLVNYKEFPGNDLFSESHVPLCSNGPEIKTNGHKRRFRLIHWRNLSRPNNHCVNVSSTRRRGRLWKVLDVKIVNMTKMYSNCFSKRGESHWFSYIGIYFFLKLCKNLFPYSNNPVTLNCWERPFAHSFLCKLAASSQTLWVEKKISAQFQFGQTGPPVLGLILIRVLFPIADKYEQLLEWGQTLIFPDMYGSNISTFIALWVE